MNCKSRTKKPSNFPPLKKENIMNNIENLENMEEMILKIRARVVLLKNINIDSNKFDEELLFGVQQVSEDIFDDLDLCLNYCINKNLN